MKQNIQQLWNEFLRLEDSLQEAINTQLSSLHSELSEASTIRVTPPE